MDTILEKLDKLQSIIERLHKLGYTTLEKDEIYIQLFDSKQGYFHVGRRFQPFGDLGQLDRLVSAELKAYQDINRVVELQR